MRQGTLAWSSPEQLEASQLGGGQKIKLTEATDVYSAGLVMVEVITNAMPSSVDMHEQCMSIDDPRLRTTCQIMLAKDPNARPSLKTVIEVIDAIRAKGDAFGMADCMRVLTGPASAPWKPPAAMLNKFDHDAICRRLMIENTQDVSLSFLCLFKICTVLLSILKENVFSCICIGVDSTQAGPGGPTCRLHGGGAALAACTRGRVLQPHVDPRRTRHGTTHEPQTSIPTQVWTLVLMHFVLYCPTVCLSCCVLLYVALDTLILFCVCVVSRLRLRRSKCSHTLKSQPFL